jgi:hypothetical protein
VRQADLSHQRVVVRGRHDPGPLADATNGGEGVEHDEQTGVGEQEERRIRFHLELAQTSAMEPVGQLASRLRIRPDVSEGSEPGLDHVVPRGVTEEAGEIVSVVFLGRDPAPGTAESDHAFHQFIRVVLVHHDEATVNRVELRSNWGVGSGVGLQNLDPRLGRRSSPRGFERSRVAVDADDAAGSTDPFGGRGEQAPVTAAHFEQRGPRCEIECVEGLGRQSRKHVCLELQAPVLLLADGSRGALDRGIRIAMPRRFRSRLVTLTRVHHSFHLSSIVNIHRSAPQSTSQFQRGVVAVSRRG